MVRSGINKTLLSLLKKKSIRKILVINFANNFVDLAEDFLSATSDARRLVAAEKLSEIILKRNDLEDMLAVRKEVRTLELMRSISYPHQTDHSAHSVYVYFLGIWLYSVVPNLSVCSNSVGKLFFPWVFAGLLHDIGYVFAEPVGALPSSRRVVERLFQPDQLATLLRPKKNIYHKDFKNFISFLFDLKRKMTWEYPCYTKGDFPDQTLNELRKIPWMPRINKSLGDDAFLLFSHLKPKNSIPVDGLETYAYSVAGTGYDGHSAGEIDHGIASALFLLQWSSYWYWLAEETRKVKRLWYDRYFQRYMFDYNVLNLTKHIVPALYSVACHNIQPTRPEGKKLLPIKLENDPLTYLAILCDELQKWDRFPAGRKNIHNLEEFDSASLVSEDIELEKETTIPRFQILGHKDVKISICKSLTKRLKDWSKIIKIL
jgi:hypothetical protein